MTKKKNRITFYIWFLATLVIRIFYFLLFYTGVQDKYGFYASAMIKIEDGDSVLSSGLGFAYTNALAKILSLFGNEINHIFIWQLILEMIACSLIFWGAQYIWGIVASTVMCSVFSISPIFLRLIKVCSPEEYFLFYFSILFYILAHFYKYTRRNSWFRSSIGEIIIVLMGFFTGMLCTWNYLGIVSLFLMLYIVVNNYRLNDDKTNILKLTGEELEEKDQIMGGFVQIFTLAIGTILGIFFTLLKYTGYSGYTIVEQFDWWKNQLVTFPRRTMDIDSSFSIYFICALIIGVIVNLVMVMYTEKQDKKLQEIEEANRLATLAGKDNAFIKHEKIEGVDYFVTDDGRKVDYIENPLPGPKKHVTKQLRFDLDEIDKENEVVRIETSKDETSISENMKKAAIGIENIVKLKRNDDNVKAKPDDFDKYKYRKMDDDFDYPVDAEDDFDI